MDGDNVENDLPHPVWSGSFCLFGVDVKCHVLNNGMRIIEAESIDNLFEAMSKGAPLAIGELENFSRWRSGK